MEQQQSEVTFRTMQTQADAISFRALNEEWIVSLFHLEDSDRQMLGDPWHSIVNQGGQVYVAEADGAIVGCVALKRLTEGVFELTKMAVASQSRGRGIGRKLLEHVLGEARALGARDVVLGSSTRLQNAVHLYETLGFTHVSPEELPIRYERASVWMKLRLG